MSTNLRKILMAEDEADIQVIATIALEKVGRFEVVMCNSGQEALTVVADFVPDLILLDMMMPDLDGVATFHALRALPGTARTPVAFMTAKVQPGEVEQYQALGALGVIAKPFDPMTLSDQILQLWRQRPHDVN